MDLVDDEGPSRKRAAPPRGADPRPGMLTVAQYKERMWRRLFRTLDYISIAISVLSIYSAALVADYLLIALIESLSRAEIKASPGLGLFLHNIKVGLALLTIVLALVHGLRSAREQYRLDAKLAKEDEKPHG